MLCACSIFLTVAEFFLPNTCKSFHDIFSWPNQTWSLWRRFIFLFFMFHDFFLSCIDVQPFFSCVSACFDRKTVPIKVFGKPIFALPLPPGLGREN